MGELVVHQTRPAEPLAAGWLRRIAGPAISACLFTGPVPPVELRPTTLAGFACKNEQDRRVFLNSRCRFWNPGSVVSLMLHEMAHRLVMEHEKSTGRSFEAHGPEFFLTVMVLYRRVDTALDGTYALVDRLALYDFQDRPPGLQHLERPAWAAEVLGWALQHFESIASSSASAESIPKLAADLWSAHAARKNAQRAEETARQGEVIRLKEQVLQVAGDARIEVGLYRIFGWTGFFASMVFALFAFVV